MAKSLDEITAIRDDLKPKYATRHTALKKLRRYWHGRYWDEVETGTYSVASIFRDLTANRSDVGPDIKLFHNVIQQICVKYQSFLSPLPQIHVYVDPPQTETRKAQSLRKQRFLYGTWAAGRMDEIFNAMGWYLPLMGDCYIGIHPDFERKLPLPVIRSPEYAYPIPSYGGGEDGVIFCWEVKESSIKRAYPNYLSRDERNPGRFPIWPWNKSRETDPMVELIEYSDHDEFVRFADGQRLAGVEHKFGFNLWEHFKFINVPDEEFGHGAVEQAVNLNEMGNALYSLLFQAVMDNVFPKLVLEDPSKAPEQIDTGPGAVLPLNPGGKAYYLSAPEGANNFHTAFLSQNEAHIKEQGGLSDPNFGQSPVSSRVTGAAIDELLGAGAGTTIEMVQGTLGSGISRWNEKAIFIAQQMFSEDTINIYGTEVHPLALNPRRFADSFKGKQLIGSSRNDVMFSPALNQHEKLVMWLQAKGGGLVSNAYIRNQVGIPDSAAMDEEIYSEAIEQGVLGAILGELQAQPTPQNADQIERQGYAFIQGQTAPAALQAGTTTPALQPPPQAGPPQAGPPQGPQAGPPPQLAAGTSGPAPGAPPPPPPGSAAPGANNAAAGKAQSVSLEQAVSAFQQVQGLQGRVFLVGEIVQRGETDGDIEVAITAHADQQTLASGLPQFAGRLVFHLVAGVPREANQEVTPGGPSQRGGGSRPSPEALNRVFVQ